MISGFLERKKSHVNVWVWLAPNGDDGKEKKGTSFFVCVCMPCGRRFDYMTKRREVFLQCRGAHLCVFKVEIREEGRGLIKSGDCGIREAKWVMSWSARSTETKKKRDRRWWVVVATLFAKEEGGVEKLLKALVLTLIPIFFYPPFISFLFWVNPLFIYFSFFL